MSPHDRTAGTPPAPESAARGDLSRPSRPATRGRDREWRLVTDLLRAAELCRGGVLLVEGTSGMGKSRLLGDAIEAAAERGFALANGRADEPSRLAPLKPLIDALGETFDTLRSSEGGVLSDAVDLRLWLLERLQIRLEERAGRGPLLIALDDLQWADPTTILALRSLIPELAYYPVAWILARTTGDVSGHVDQDVERLFGVLERDGAARVILAALDDQAVVQVATDVLGAEPEPRLLAVAAAAGGNPFLLIELLEGLRDECAVEIAQGHARLVAELVPRRVRQRVHAWLCALPPRTRYLLQVAAVLGSSFRVGDLADMLGEPPSELLQALEEAAAGGILVPAGDMLAFRHDLLWQAMTETLTEPVRQALHRQAAEMLLDRGGSAIPAAAHLVRYARPGDAHALSGLDRAAQEVLPSSPKTAADLAVRALDLTPAGDPGRFGRTVTSIYALTAAGRLSEATELIHTALSQTAAPDEVRQLRYELAHVLMLSGRPVEAVAEAEQVLGSPGLPDRLRGLAENVRFRSLYAIHDYVSGRKDAEAVVAPGGSTSGPAVAGAHVMLGSIAWAEGRAADAIEHTSEAVRVASSGPIQTLHTTHPRLHLATLLTDLRQFEQAETLIQAAGEEIHAFGHIVHAASPALHRARLRLAAGRLDDAGAEARAALTITDEVGMRAFVLLTIGVLVIVAVRRGEMDAAAGYVEQYRSEHQAGEGAMYARGWADWAIAVTAEAQGDAERAMAILEAPYTEPVEQRWLLMVEPSAAAFLTRTALSVANRSAAEAVAATAEQIARNNPEFTTLAASAAQARGILHRDAEALAQAAARHLGPWDRASAAEDLGVLLGQGPDPGAAIQCLDRALDGYQEICACRDVARIRARLRRLGVRRRHWTRSERPASGWASLTDTERDVAALVAQGLTNPQVAAQLFVSRHTVNFHLRQVFRKLDIGSRVELARIADDRPASGT
ncbi:MAG: AAA family ATPase [Actinomadura sp.]